MIGFIIITTIILMDDDRVDVWWIAFIVCERNLTFPIVEMRSVVVDGGAMKKIEIEKFLRIRFDAGRW